MNPGIGEEAGKAANATIDALKSTPVVFALVLFNVLFMFLIAYMSLKSSERWDHEIERWAELVKSCQASKISP
jgi:hypothetical protein